MLPLGRAASACGSLSTAAITGLPPTPTPQSALPPLQHPPFPVLHSKSYPTDCYIVDSFSWGTTSFNLVKGSRKQAPCTGSLHPQTFPSTTASSVFSPTNRRRQPLLSLLLSPLVASGTAGGITAAAGRYCNTSTPLARRAAVAVVLMFSHPPTWTASRRSQNFDSADSEASVMPSHHTACTCVYTHARTYHLRVWLLLFAKPVMC